MFRHQGKSRTLKHNLRIASILSFVAGIVNVTGFLAFKQLATNVTGHFALFINDVAEFKVWKGTIYFLYIFSFLFGSFVTKISNAIVRTTHLTGLFTDLGIELSQLFFPKTHPHREKIKATIKLRIFIICFFFMGGLIGGFMYSKLDLKLNTLILGAIILVISLFYDDFRYQFIRTRRKFKHKKSKVK